MHQMADTGGQMAQGIRRGNTLFGIHRLHGVDVVMQGAFVIGITRNNRLQRFEDRSCVFFRLAVPGPVAPGRPAG